VTETEVFQELRPLMFAIAYRMLGSVADAEDITQEAFLRYHRAVSGGADIESPKAFLSAVTTRLSIDQLRSARARRESYLGPWLPEPLLADQLAPDPGQRAEAADSLSMAFLLLLERLTPLERAAFLLRDVFGYEYGEIAEIISKSEANCRQLAARARRHVTENRPRFTTSREQREALADRFFDAIGDGEIDGLVSMLADDVVVYGDGGGAGPSWLRPIEGAASVVRLLAGVSRDFRQLGITARRAEINGQPGALFLDPYGRLVSILCLDISAGAVQVIRSVINPGKLQHLGPLADLRELQRQRGRRAP
jgi:RNA polymerase sigma-70 factor (ECF subfamily)